MADQDLELLREWHKGSQTAAAELVRRHTPALKKFFDNKVLAQDVDEMVQLTWLAMTKNQQRALEGGVDSSQAVESVRAYIRGVARHTVFGYYRQRAGKPDFDPEVDSIATIAPSVSQALSLRRNVARLEMAMQSLPLEFQLIAEARFIDELSGPELAEMFEIPEGTVRSRLRRAKATIDELMQRWNIHMGKPTTE
jgi:RNA polymerase sigma factor (sigma-70 family)